MERRSRNTLIISMMIMMMMIMMMMIIIINCIETEGFSSYFCVLFPASRHKLFLLFFVSLFPVSK